MLRRIVKKLQRYDGRDKTEQQLARSQGCSAIKEHGYFTPSSITWIGLDHDGRKTVKKGGRAGTDIFWNRTVQDTAPIPVRNALVISC